MQRSTAPHVPVILDARRGDIGSTASQYAMEAFERYGADAQGGDSVATVRAGWRLDAPIIVNSSRAVLYASAGEDFAGVARREAIRTRDMLQAARG